MIKRFLVLVFVLLTHFMVKAQGVQHLQAWNEFRTIKSGDTHEGDWFGYSATVDTNYAAVGAPLHDFSVGATSSSTTLSSDYLEDAGAAYIYRRFGSDWESQAKLVSQDRAAGDMFGWSISVSGQFAAVGAPETKTNTAGTGSLNQAGAVYIFQYVSGNWVQVAKIVAPDRAAQDFFGHVVVLRGFDLFVGAPYEDEDQNQQNMLANAGSVYHFVRSGNQWSYSQKLVASDRAFGNEFGSSISINNQTLVVGAKMASGSSAGAAGAAYVFTPSSGVWSQTGKLMASDGASFDGFGSSLSVFGSRIAVGSPGHSSARGAVYMFSNNQGWSQTQKILASDAQVGDRFGHAISLFKDTLAVGSPREAHNTLGTSGSTTSQNGYLASAGSAYIFHFANNLWAQAEKVNTLGRISGAELGHTVSIFRQDLIVGAPYATDPLTEQGKTWLIGKDKFVWVGNQSSDPNNGLNWMHGAIPPAQHEFIYRKGAFDPEYTVALNASILTIWDQVEIKTIPHTNTMVPQPTILGGEIYNRGKVSLLANSTGYTSLFFRSYLGSGTVRQEQWIPNVGWHQIGSPMQGGWPNLFGGDSTKLIPWDEQMGQYGPQGYLVEEFGRGFFAQAVSNGAFGSGPFMIGPNKISVEGRPNTSGAFMIGYANNPNPQNAAYTSAVTDGWNLLANPFTCPIDFVWLGLTRMDNSYSIWNQSLNAGQGAYEYYSFSGGSLSRYIPPFQAFWVRAQDQTASISPTTIAVSGSVVNPSKFRKRPSFGIKLSVSNDTGSISDAIWVTPIQGSSAGVADLARDALKRMNASPLPNFFVSVGGLALATKGIEPQQIQELDLFLKIAIPGEMCQIHADVPDSSSGRWYVLDRLMNKSTLLEDGWNEMVQLRPEDSLRFALRFIPWGYLESIDPVSLQTGFVYNNGAVAGYFHSGPKASYELVDAIGRTVDFGVVHDGSNILWSALPSGAFVLRVGGNPGKTLKVIIP